MNFFYLVPSKDINKFIANDQTGDTKINSILNSSVLPPNNTLQLYNQMKRINPVETNVVHAQSQSENSSGEHQNKEITIDHNKSDKVLHKQIIPLYVNTLSKQYRDSGYQLVNKLLTSEDIEIDQSGEITSPHTQYSINLEDFLRVIFQKNASVKHTSGFFSDMIKYIDSDIINNRKLIDIKTSGVVDTENYKGGAIVPRKFWCIYR